MTPQGTFTILAPIVPSRLEELRSLLQSMNERLGSVNPNNPLVPFAQFDTLHFARFAILDDQTVGDLRIYGFPSAPIRCISPSSVTLTARRRHSSTNW
jgi:hypothetical protein